LSLIGKSRKEYDPEDQEILALVLAAQGGDRTALSTLIERYTPLLRSIVNHFCQSEKPNDARRHLLLQIGQSAMIDAILGYRNDRGTKLATPMRVYIRNAIIKQIESDQHYDERFTGLADHEVDNLVALSTTYSENAYATFIEVLSLLPEDQRFALEMVSSGESKSNLAEISEKYSRYRWEIIFSEAVENITNLQNDINDFARLAKGERPQKARSFPDKTQQDSEKDRTEEK